MKAAFENARAALAFLESHQIAPSPANYALALQAREEPDGPLARQIATFTDGGLRLTADQVAVLIERHGGGAAAAAIDAREQAVSVKTAELTSLTTGAHDLTTALGRDVDAFASDRDRWTVGADAFSDRLSQAGRDLATMREDISSLRDRLTPPNGRTAEDGEASDGLANPVIDTMTDALTRRGAEAMLAQLADSDQGFALILVQLDGLIAINDRYGQSVGNNVLTALVTTLRQAFPDQELIRWSGNEFLIVMLNSAMTAVRDQLGDALDAMAARRLRLRDSGQYIGTVTASAAIVSGRRESGVTALGRARRRLSETADKGDGRLVS
ncbi:diguanylate cyclase [uncultured Sphingomonas sp.]|uniref:sensor domain-containing diguanylate cyclase n=1 Tax=uncultured Sphingomonas sp. TaxID=158754 RepID=UPI0025EC35EF|nr:diguanylate cyclase [uncultured Sphingomonas sp.]